MRAEFRIFSMKANAVFKILELYFNAAPPYNCHVFVNRHPCLAPSLANPFEAVDVGHRGPDLYPPPPGGAAARVGMVAASPKQTSSSLTGRLVGPTVACGVGLACLEGGGKVRWCEQHVVDVLNRRHRAAPKPYILSHKMNLNIYFC